MRIILRARLHPEQVIQFLEEAGVSPLDIETIDNTVLPPFIEFSTVPLPSNLEKVHMAASDIAAHTKKKVTVEFYSGGQMEKKTYEKGLFGISVKTEVFNFAN